MLITKYKIDFIDDGDQGQTKVCEINEATCRNGDCIPRSSLRDGRPDCSDNSDENFFGTGTGNFYFIYN